MERLNILQGLIKDNDYKTYLEIGVHKGLVFLELDCPLKLAVDPRFQIDFTRKLKTLLKKPANLKNKYFEMTSNDFFSKHQGLLNASSPDLVFVDGLHTFKGSLQDVLNSLKYLNKNGCIVVHDCFPPRKAAATPANSYQEVERLKPEGWNGLWCGDVWKTIVYLKKKYAKELEVVVLNTDFGLGIIKPQEIILGDLKIDQRLYDEISELDYSYLRSDPERIISLRDKEFLLENGRTSI